MATEIAGKIAGGVGATGSDSEYGLDLLLSLQYDAADSVLKAAGFYAR